MPVRSTASTAVPSVLIPACEIHWRTIAAETRCPCEELSTTSISSLPTVPVLRTRRTAEAAKTMYAATATHSRVRSVYRR